MWTCHGCRDGTEGSCEHVHAVVAAWTHGHVSNITPARDAAPPAQHGERSCVGERRGTEGSVGKSSRRPRLGAAECGEIKPPAAARRRGRARGARSPVHRAPASRLHDDQAPGPRASPACEAAASAPVSRLSSVRPPAADRRLFYAAGKERSYVLILKMRVGRMQLRPFDI